MPNDCWNTITITASELELNALMATEFKDVPERAFSIQRRGPYGVVLRLWSPWKPDFTWLETLLVTYPSCWVKNEWHEEGGSAGVWVGHFVGGGHCEIKRMEWEDLSIEEEVRVFRDSKIVE
jgi:hypothetical protein